MRLRVYLFLTTTIVAIGIAALSLGRGLRSAPAASSPAPSVASACTIYDVTGVIRAPLDDDGGVTVAHGDISGYMPAMTMRFAVGDRGDAATLRTGDRVRFHLRVGPDTVTATDFTVTGFDPNSAATTPGVPVRRLHEGDIVPPFALVSETNQPLDADIFANHATLVTFIFTRCPVPEYCPAIARRYGQLQRAILSDPALASQARLLSITLDPEFDRPNVLQAYGAAVGANPTIWRFATGEKSVVDSLTNAFSVYAERNGVTLEHTLCTALIDGNGRVAQIWRDNDWNTDQVLGALKAACTDSSEP